MVKHILPIVLTLTPIASGVVSADNKVIQEFTSAEVYYRHSNSPDPNPSQMLRKNVESAIATTLSKKTSNAKEILENLQSSDMQFHKAEGTQIVYATYQDYVFEFRYANDPTRFHLVPTEYKVWKKPDDMKKRGELNTNKE